MRTHLHEYRTRYRIFDLFLSSPRAWLYVLAVKQTNMSSGLDQLTSASSISDTLRDIQEELRSLRKDINRLKANGPTPPPREPALIPRSGDQDPTQRVSGTSWVEEMDIIDPILDEQPGDEACVVEVSPRTGACITASFHSMTNSSRRTLQSKFILPKAPITHTPRLDKIYADSYSKSTKQTDKSLAHLQALMLDAVGPISKALEQLNIASDNESEEIELDLEKLGSALETALTFLGNASTQPSNLRRVKLMEDINKELVTYTTEQEEHFTAQAPMLFGNEFMKNATEHWEQVKALRKMRDHPSTSSVFQKSYSHPRKKKVAVRRAPNSKEARSAPKVQK